MQTKICAKCGKEKPLDEFHKDSTRISGHYPRCKICVKEYHRVNSKILSQNTREWNRNNPERLRINQQRHYAKPEYKEKVRQRSVRKRAEHPEINREQCKRWRENNREHSRMLAARYLKEHPELGRIKHNARRERLYSGNCNKFSAEEWQQLCEKYDNRCLCCGKKKKLTMDHIIPVSLGGSNGIDNIQPLCRECNSSKNIKIIDYRILDQVDEIRAIGDYSLDESES